MNDECTRIQIKPKWLQKDEDGIIHNISQYDTELISCSTSMRSQTNDNTNMRRSQWTTQQSNNARFSNHTHQDSMYQGSGVQGAD